MNYIDIIIILIVLFEAWRGFMHGLIVEVFTLAALLLGVFVAMRYAYISEDFLEEYLLSEKIVPYVRYISLGVTFLLVLIVVKIIGYLLTKIAEAVALGLINKLLGVMFAVCKAVVVICVLIMIVSALDNSYMFLSPETKSESLFYYPLLEIGDQVYNQFSNK